MKHLLLSAKGIASMCSAVGLGVMGVFQLNSNPISALRDITEMSLVLSSIVGVAYLMRSDVADLKRWRTAQDTRSAALEKLAIELAAACKQNAEAIHELKADLKDHCRERHGH